VNITDKSAKELQAILQSDLNQQISVQQARRLGEWILRFYSHLQNKSGTGMNPDGNQRLNTSTTNKDTN
jgi:hypothetical protein